MEVISCHLLIDLVLKNYIINFVPLDSFIKTQVMLYYSRIQSDGINPLVKEAFNINKNISSENIYTWYTFATEIFKKVELNKK